MAFYDWLASTGFGLNMAEKRLESQRHELQHYLAAHTRNMSGVLAFEGEYFLPGIRYKPVDGVPIPFVVRQSNEQVDRRRKGFGLEGDLFLFENPHIAALSTGKTRIVKDSIEGRFFDGGEIDLTFTAHDNRLLNLVGSFYGANLYTGELRVGPESLGTFRLDVKTLDDDENLGDWGVL